MNPILRILETSRDYLLQTCPMARAREASETPVRLVVKPAKNPRGAPLAPGFDSLAFRTLVEFEFDD